MVALNVFSFFLPPTVGPRVSATKAFGVQRGCSSISTNLCEPRSRLGLFAARVLRGVREVQTHVVPYAEAWQRHNRDAAAASGPLWVAMGDSMAQGIGASAYDRGWVGQLAESLPEHRLVNLSVNGGRVTDLLDVAAVVRHAVPEYQAEPAAA